MKFFCAQAVWLSSCGDGGCEVSMKHMVLSTWMNVVFVVYSVCSDRLVVTYGVHVGSGS